MTSTEVVMLMGAPASGKGTVGQSYIDRGYVHLNRDTEGGKVKDLVPKLQAALVDGKSVVLDNLYATVENRAPFIAAAKAAGIPIRAERLTTSIEDAIINALHRMWDRYGCIFYTAEDIKEHPKAKKDPNIFPIAVLFAYKKAAEKPSKDEGFSEIKNIPFRRKPLAGHDNKAVIFDYDDTLRTVTPGAAFKYPTDIKEVKLLRNRIAKVQACKDDGYILLGVSNQSGIARGNVTEAAARACFEHTNNLVGQDIDFRYCPHNVPPRCYCRKPQSGLGVALIRQYKLDPFKCIFFGDQTTDRTFANRLGMSFQYAHEFFD